MNWKAKAVTEAGEYANERFRRRVANARDLPGSDRGEGAIIGALFRCPLDFAGNLMCRVCGCRKRF